MDDESILDALRAGDPAAVRALRARYRGRLVAVVAQICGDLGVAEEMSEDILSDFVVDHAPGLRAAGAMGGYLRLMAVRRAVRHRDRGRRHVALGDEVAGEAPALEAALDAPARHARLADCVAELPVRTQRMLRLRFGGEASLGEVGAALGLSKQFVARVVGDALARLRRCLLRAGFGA
ncbi:MAG: sigma-70 family RNA polymerase sigma factor [bacterium]